MDAPFIDIHTHRQPTPPVIGILSVRLCGKEQKFPAQGMFSAGIHPWDAELLDEKTLEAMLARLESAPGIAAIGEIGLDYSRAIDRARQHELLCRQLAIAERRRLPVVLHCVRTFGPLMDTLKKFSLSGVIFHSFTGSIQQAQIAVVAGNYISLGGRSLRSRATVEALPHIPHERIFLETDEDDQTIGQIYDQAAKHLGISTKELVEIVYNNFKTLFP